MKSIQKALTREELREILYLSLSFLSLDPTHHALPYRAIFVHVLDLLMNVANQPKALQKKRYTTL